jgi:tRNA(Ile)-lysidine synthase TilS/MesJ
VTYSPAILAEHLLDLEKKASRPARFVIAFSGGLDSSVLAQSLAELKKYDWRQS